MDDNYEIKEYKVNQTSFEMEEANTFVLREADIEEFISSGAVQLD